MSLSNTGQLFQNSSIPEGTFTGTEMDSLMNAAIAMSAISFVGSSLVIWSYFYFPQLKKFAFRLVVMLAISDLGSGVGYFIGSPPNGPVCTLQAVFLHYFQLSSFLWTTVIAFVLERTVCRQQGAWLEQKRHLLHLYAWGLPLICVLLPFTTAHLMPDGLAYSNTFAEWSDKSVGAWCWIGQDDGHIGTMWRFVTFYIPLWLCMFYNIYSYNKVVTMLKTTLNNQGGNQYNEAYKQKMKIVFRLRWYPAILTICWFFGTINRIQNAVSPRGPIFWLYLLHSIFSSAQGFCNSMVYGLNKGVQAAWREKFPESARLADSMCCGCYRICGCGVAGTTRFRFAAKASKDTVELAARSENGDDAKVSV